MKKGAETEIGDEIAYPVLWGLFNKSHKKLSKHIIYLICIIIFNWLIFWKIQLLYHKFTEGVNQQKTCCSFLQGFALKISVGRPNEVWDPPLFLRNPWWKVRVFTPKKVVVIGTPEMGIFPRRNFFSGKSRMREGEVVMKDFFRQKSAFRWILFVVFFFKLNIYHIYHIYTPWILETTQCMVYIYIPFFVCPLRTHVVYNIHVYIGIVSFLPLQWTCGCGLTHDSIFQVGPFTFGPLEDHPNGCKWLGSPLFISHGLRPFGKGNKPYL